MKKITFFLLLALFSSRVFSQDKKTDFNLGFENVSVKGALPDGWKTRGGEGRVTLDSAIKHGGKYSLLLASGANEGATGFTGCVLNINQAYQGSEIKLKGYLKLENVKDGYAGLWMRIDGAGSALEFNNMGSQNLHGSSDWKEYTIDMALPEGAQSIHLGALLTGSGKVWVDDLQILISGKDITEAKLRPPSKIKADNDHEFDSGSHVAEIPLSSQKITDLNLLGKVWGYLKYYHASIAKGHYNWDYELFRFLPKYMACTAKTERNELLLSWIESLGTLSEATHLKGANDKNVRLKRDVNWIYDTTTLGSKLSAMLLKVDSSEREFKSYYVSLDMGVENPVFANERSYSNFDYPDAGFRLLALYRYWNMIEYYFPDRGIMGVDWDSVMTAFIPKIINAKTSLEYRLTLLELIANIHDTHAQMNGDEKLEQNKGKYCLPVTVTFAEDKAVIIKVRDSNLGLKVGDVIEKINNKNVSDIIKERVPYTPASNYPTQLRNISIDLLRTKDTTMLIAYSRDNKTNEQRFKCAPYRYALMFNKADTCYKKINSDISYLYLGNIKEGYLPKLMPQINNSKGLIIDLRCYPSYFIIYELSNYLMASTDFVKFTQVSTEYPGTFEYGVKLPAGESSLFGKKIFKGKVVILVNEETQSQAEFTAMALRKAPGAIVVGSTTAGADGNVSFVSLPGGVKTLFSGLGVYYPDGKETQRVGIIPDVICKPTIKGIKEGLDEPLEKAIEIISSY